MKLRHTELSIPAGTIWLRARLAHAPDVRGLVIIAHTNNGEANGSVDARFAQALQSAGFATFQLDLITDQEAARDTDVRFNTPLLAPHVSKRRSTGSTINRRSTVWRVCWPHRAPSAVPRCARQAAPMSACRHCCVARDVSTLPVPAHWAQSPCRFSSLSAKPIPAAA